MDLTQASDEELWNVLWTEGDLTLLLNSSQLNLYNLLQQELKGPFVLECSRRWGKSWFCTLFVVMRALKTPNTMHYYFAQSLDAVRDIVDPTMNEILETCPEHLRPVYKAQDHRWVFPNGSTIRLIGANNIEQNTKRGPTLTTVVVDEAGEIKDLDNLYGSIIRPALLGTFGRKRGVALMAGTPASRPGHSFELYCDAAEANGLYLRQTVEDCPHISAAEREAWKADVLAISGMDRWMREAYCQRVVDRSALVVPEFLDSRDTCVTETVDPDPKLDLYTAGDLGYEDLTVFLFGYYDFLRDVDVVQDELVARRTNSDEIARMVYAKEQQLWGDREPHLRAADGPKITLASLDYAGRQFAMPPKQHKQANINQMRVRIANQKLEIDPRCKQLIAHLKSATWNPQRTSYQRNEVHGHYDAVDALNYFVASIDRQRMPKHLTVGENYTVPYNIRKELEEGQDEWEWLK